MNSARKRKGKEIKAKQVQEERKGAMREWMVEVSELRSLQTLQLRLVTGCLLLGAKLLQSAIGTIGVCKEVEGLYMSCMYNIHSTYMANRSACYILPSLKED